MGVAGTGRVLDGENIYDGRVCVGVRGVLRRGRGGRREAVRPIRFGTYNICNGWNGGIESALKGIPQANVDLGVFQETKVTKWVYMREPSGYWVVVSNVPSAHSGGAAMLYH